MCMLVTYRVGSLDFFSVTRKTKLDDDRDNFMTRIVTYRSCTRTIEQLQLEHTHTEASFTISLLRQRPEA